ncbi:transcobalamin-2 isoform X2 [Catharus ustulatus]|uniref:transcobalamin-2 isoform X2 n=1 Tax=Catharus ustulatus TaxID=91951 RepID=UPI00140CEF17|nr:transcobalamin-2 isoform X2 [Catharus ustulatus]
MWLPLVLLLLLPAVLPARCCEVPEGSAGAVRALSARLLGLAGDPARDPDPSVYLALRLAREHDPQLEQRYLERLQDAFRHPYGRSLQAHGHSRWNAEHSTSVAEPPQTGRLALYLLGLRATCPSPHSHRTLVTWLKYYLEEDWIGSWQDGHPLTTYYQYGLGMLALCVHHKRVREGVIRRLLTAQNYGKLGHHGNLVDTRAVVALAFTCLEQRRLVDTDLAAELRVAAHSVNRGLAEIQGSNGIIGNIYSTPWALQVFLATGTCQTESAFSQGMAALLENLEAFGTAATMAQVLPVLHGRSYLDIASMHCQDEPGTLTPLDMEPLAEVPGNKMVQLVVECPLPWCYELRLYDRPVLVPASASLLDVLQAATALKPHIFKFHTQDTPQGPFLTQVLGLEARQEKRNYWQLLTAPDTPLQMGIADYRPKDGETLILRLSEW